MTGKVFNESSNIYQDQAKILFDYYKSAAEAIVAAEMKEEQNKADLIKGRENEVNKLNRANNLKKIFLIIGIVTLVIVIGLIFLALAIKNHIDAKKAQKEIEYYDAEIQKSDERYKNIRREYSIDKMGVVYVPMATRVPVEDKSFLLDHTGGVKETNFELSVLRQPEEFKESVQKLVQSMDSLPIVEDNRETETVNTSEYSVSVQNITLNDYVGNVDRQMRNISYLLDESDVVSVNIPVIMPESDNSNFIKEHATNDTGKYPVVDVFHADFGEKLKKLESLNSLKDQVGEAGESDSNEVMKKVMQQISETVQIFTNMKNSSMSKMVNYTTSIFNLVMKSAYTQYSPQLEAEEIERIRMADFNYATSVNDYTPFHLKTSSKVKYDIFSGNWVAEDATRTSMPFGMHQIDEEILMPIISSLMEENRIERLRIYNNIEDQKRDYLERWSSETGDYFRDNRRAADELITHMRETYADYMSAYSMYKSIKETSNSMKETKNIENSEVLESDNQEEMIAGFELQAKQCNEQQEEFAEFMDRIQESITEATNSFSYIKYYEGELRDAMPHEVAEAMSEIYDLDERRKGLVGISPYVANNAELLPEPMVSDEMTEDMGIDLATQAAERLQQLGMYAKNTAQ